MSPTKSVSKKKTKRTKLPVAFISYSWDSPEHKGWVRALAGRLTANGVEVILDQWHIAPGESLTHFMESSIDRADYVLVICTPNYARRSDARRGGVGYEQQIISGRIAFGLKDKRFIPVIRRGTLVPGRKCAIPIHFTGLYALDMRKVEHIDRDFEDLVRVLHAEPRFRPPPLGSKPTFRSGITTKAKFSIKSGRLPAAEVDGFELVSGVIQAEKYPDTFFIPSENARKKLNAGDMVKLIFSLFDSDLSDDSGQLVGERIWVSVVGQRGSYLVGKLMNQPLASDEDG